MALELVFELHLVVGSLGFSVISVLVRHQSFGREDIDRATQF